MIRWIMSLKGLILSFICILIFNIVFLEFVTFRLIPFSNDKCNKILYASILNDKKWQTEDYYHHNNNNEIYNSIINLTLNDSIKSCDGLKYVDYIEKFTYEINDGNTKLLESFNKETRINRLIIINQIDTRVAVDLSILGEVKPSSILIKNANISNSQYIGSMSKDGYNSITLDHVNTFDFSDLSEGVKNFSITLNSVDSIQSSTKIPLNEGQIQSMYLSIENPKDINLNNLSNLSITQLELKNVDPSILSEVIKFKEVHHLIIQDDTPFDLSQLKELNNLKNLSITKNFLEYGENPKIIEELKSNGSEVSIYY